MVDRAWCLSDVTAVLKPAAFGATRFKRSGTAREKQIGTLTGFILQIQSSFLERRQFTAENF